VQRKHPAAHLEGIVTSTTAMMNMPGVAADLRQAKTEAPRLGVGVHLNFTAGRPLLPPEWCASLVDAHGHFLTQEAIMAAPDRLKPDDREELKSRRHLQMRWYAARPSDAHHCCHAPVFGNLDQPITKCRYNCFAPS
jgi:predicted glycoside hydrolase/deacetylase ChbG (UPF0249 family)